MVCAHAVFSLMRLSLVLGNAMSSMVGEEGGNRCAKVAVFRAQISIVVFFVYSEVTRTLLWVMARILHKTRGWGFARLRNRFGGNTRPPTKLPTIREDQTHNGRREPRPRFRVEESYDGSEESDGTDDEDYPPYAAMDGTDVAVHVEPTAAQPSRGEYVFINVYNVGICIILLAVWLQFDLPINAGALALSLLAGARRRMRGGVLWKIGSFMCVVACLLVGVDIALSGKDANFGIARGSVVLTLFSILQIVLPGVVVVMIHVIQDKQDLRTTLKNAGPFSGVLAMTVVSFLSFDPDRCMATQGAILAGLVSGDGSLGQAPMRDGWDTLALLTYIPITTALCVFSVFSAVLSERSPEAGAAVALGLSVRNMMVMAGDATVYSSTGVAAASVSVALMMAGGLNPRRVWACIRGYPEGCVG